MFVVILIGDTAQIQYSFNPCFGEVSGNNSSRNYINHIADALFLASQCRYFFLGQFEVKEAKEIACRHTLELLAIARLKDAYAYAKTYYVLQFGNLFQKQYSLIHAFLSFSKRLASVLMESVISIIFAAHSNKNCISK